MSKVKAKDETSGSPDLTGLQAALKHLADDVPKDLHATLDPILGRLEEGIKTVDLTLLLGERNQVIEDLREILHAGLVLIEEDECLRCGRKRGEPHGRGGCAAQARIETARARIDQA